MTREHPTALPSSLRRAIRLGVLMLIAVVAMGNQSGCPQRTPNLTCTDMAITLGPGECVDIANPCDPAGAWTRTDGFRLCDAPDLLWVTTSRTRSGSTRMICAAGHIATFTDEPATFLYSRPRDYGEGDITITTLPQFAVSVHASPASVLPNDPVVLSASVVRGQAPYSYFWVSDPNGQIDNQSRTLPSPTVYPTVSTTYHLTITDSLGDTAVGSVDVHVGLLLDLSPDPAIAVGGATQLNVTPRGGDGNYTYQWSPAIGLDDPTRSDPIATLQNTTTYTVDVSDGSGLTASGQVTVTVLMEATATATPALDPARRELPARRSGSRRRRPLLLLVVAPRRSEQRAVRQSGGPHPRQRRPTTSPSPTASASRSPPASRCGSSRCSPTSTPASHGTRTRRSSRSPTSTRAAALRAQDR